jgi:hypothetical protein
MSPDEFGKVGNKSDMQAGSDDQIVPIRDRVLYWPTVLAVFWSAAFINYIHGPGEPGIGSMPPLIVVGWLMSAGVAVMISFAWIYQRAWRRLLSTLILPLSILVLIYYSGS